MKKGLLVFVLFMMIIGLGGSIFADNNFKYDNHNERIAGINEEIQPMVGGGDSGFWYKQYSYPGTVARPRLVDISYELRKVERNNGRYLDARVVDIVSAVGGSINGYLGMLSLLNLENGIQREFNRGIEDIFDSLSRYPDNSTIFRLQYSSYTKETPNSPSFTMITAVDRER